MATKLSDNINDVIDLDISVTRKKRFRFDRDDNRLVDLNIADMNIMSRLAETYPKLLDFLEEVKSISDMPVDENTEDTTTAITQMQAIGDKLKEIDTKMRTSLDYIFNAPVSAAASPDGSMYDIFEGQFRFEYILDLLLSYYENNLTTEFAKLKKHTAKYTKK